MRRRLAVATFLGALVARPTAAHAGSLSREVTGASVPSWLVVMTGGAVIAGSFLFASLLTDHEAIAIVNGWHLDLPTVGRRAAAWALSVAGLAALVVIVVAGVAGPLFPTRNLAIVWVWGGWWAGYTISVYALGNTWPALNPWRTLVNALGTVEERRTAGSALSLPERGAGTLPDWVNPWGSVAGLLGLVWLEVVSPVSGNPRFLALVVLAYTAVTVGGAWRYGPDNWFRDVDPVARVFRVYGRLAPFQRTDDGLEFRLPGTALTTGPSGDGEVPFVVALLWATTYDGLMATPAWAGFVRTVLDGVAVLALPLYLAVIVAGYWLFLRGYRYAASRTKESADTYVTVAAIERWFVPSLVPIAAGYHVAHYLGYFLSLLPAMTAVLAAPLSAGSGFVPLTLPAWYGNVQLLFVVLGHLLAIYVAHAISFDVFPGKLAPIRSQYPLVMVMVFYTMTSVWIITQPFVEPPLV